MVPEFATQVLNDSPFYQGAMILIISLLLSKIAPLPRDYQPIVWFGILARELAAKVNHPGRAPSQQIIAGTLASALLVLPFSAIMTFLMQLAAFPWFFEFITLYICLNDENFNQTAREVKQALIREEKGRARSTLSPWLYRDTRELSEVGIAKATIEKLVTTPVYGTVSTIIFFGIGGAPLVLITRMLKQLELCWPAINPKFTHFGKPTYLLSTLFFLIPGWLWNISMAIQGGPKSILNLFKPLPNNLPFYNCIHTCAIAASVLNIELGGPMKFNGAKIETPKLSYGPKPDGQSITSAIRLANTTYGIWIFFVISMPLIWAGLRYLHS